MNIWLLFLTMYIIFWMKSCFFSQKSLNLSYFIKIKLNFNGVHFSDENKKKIEPTISSRPMCNLKKQKQ